MRIVTLNVSTIFPPSLAASGELSAGGSGDPCRNCHEL